MAKVIVKKMDGDEAFSGFDDLEATIPLPRIKVSKPKTVKPVKKVAKLTVQESDERTATNQARRFGFLTDIQKTWGVNDWTAFLSGYAFSASDELSDRVLQQLNYGRVYLRINREEVFKAAQQVNKEEAKAHILSTKIEDDVEVRPEHAPFLHIEIEDVTPSDASDIIADVGEAEKSPFDDFDDLMKEDVHAPVKYTEAQKTVAPEVKKFDKQVAQTQNFKQGHSLEEQVQQLVRSSQPITEAAVEAIEQSVKSPSQHIKDAMQAIKEEKASSAEAEMFAANPENKMWGVAEEFARKGKTEEWQTLGIRMQAMIQYCADMIRQTGEVERPFDVMDLFIPRPKILDMSHAGVIRRDELVNKILDYWKKKINWADENGVEYNLGSQSYRVILAASQLEGAIEGYVNNFRHAGLATHIPDEEFSKRVGASANAYFNAHAPIPKEKIKPGPISNIDPDYMQYLEICRDYKIEVGLLLHEVIL